MKRLNFASVMTVLCRNINGALCPNRLGLIEILFCDMGCSPESCMELDKQHGKACTNVLYIAEVYTRDTNLKKRMRKYAEKYPELCQQTDDDG